MSPFSPPKVLLLAQKPDSARRWAELLRVATVEVWQSQDEVPPGGKIEVIVTDRTPPDFGAQPGGATPLGCDADGDRPAIVGIGTVNGADVTLPADCSGRELCLACTLSAEIARLRSRQADAATIRQEFDQLAYIDPLTGLANRRAWDRQFPARLQLAQSAGKQLWLAIVDLDRFKQVNDNCGLLAGDDVLRGAAQALAAQLRRDDLIARLGGDEFAVLLLGVDEQGAGGVFDRLRAAVRGQEVPPGASGLSASLGYATPAAGQAGAADLRELFVAAEQALRQAKMAGGDRACRGE